MKHAYLPEYGHARCPHCEFDFDLAKATPTFRESWPEGETGIYILCSPCHRKFSAANKAGRQRIARTCFRRVKTCRTDGKQLPWAVVTELALWLVNGDLVRLWEDGVPVPLSIYEGIRAGKYVVTNIPGLLLTIDARDSGEESCSKA